MPDDKNISEGPVPEDGAGRPEAAARDEPSGSRSLAGRLVGGGLGRARGVASATGIDQAIEKAVEEALVRAVESEATERAVARILNGPAVEQAVSQALRSPAVEQAVIDVVDSEVTERVWARVLASDETQLLIERIAGSPEIRKAVTAQGAGLLTQFGARLASASDYLDGMLGRFVARLFRRRQPVGPTDRAGLVTRAVALAVDGFVINVILASAGVAIGLIAPFIGLDDNPHDRIMAGFGAAAWLVWTSIYLLTFWTLLGQTPGMRLLGLRVETVDGSRVGARVAGRRLLGFWLAALPLGLGFLGVILRPGRRGLQDRLAGTVVRFHSRR